MLPTLLNTTYRDASPRRLASSSSIRLDKGERRGDRSLPKTVMVKEIFVVLLLSGIQDSHAKMAQEVDCLARNIYFEARNQSERARAAVGYVTMQRVKSEHYPNSVCRVVYQRKQFSWTLLPKAKQIIPKAKQKNKKIERKEWLKIKKLAAKIYRGLYKKNPVKGATHFHTTKVKPKWAKKMTRIAKIGDHIFYK